MDRPGPPPRSYSQLVVEEVQDATDHLLHFSLSSPSPQHAASPDAASIASRRSRSSTVGSNSSRIRRRRSADELRLPAVGDPATSDVGERESGGIGSDEAARAGPDLEEDMSSSTATLRPPIALRRTTSADLLVRDEGEEEEEDDFSSDNDSFCFRPPSIASTTTSQRSSSRGVRVEDWSDRQSSSFVKDVRITGFHIVGLEGSGYVVYECEIHTLSANPTAAGSTIRVHKRYSAFTRLRSELLRSFPRLRPLIPRLPPKSTFAKYRPSFLERRRQLLGFWLSSILLHPVLGGCPQVREWILE